MKPSKTKAPIHPLTAPPIPALGARSGVILQPWQHPTPEEFHPATESPADAEHLDLGRRLCLWLDGSPKAVDLARQMPADATSAQVQFSLASARACRVARRRIISAVLPTFNQRLADEGELWFVTAILPRCYRPLGQLHLFDARKLRERLRLRIRRAIERDPGLAGGTILGMIETSVRLYEGRHAGHQVHVHFVCDGQGLRALRCMPRRRFGEGPEQVWQPVLPLPIVRPDTLARRLGYTLKMQARTWCPHRRISNSTGEAGPVYQHELPPDLLPEALIWMSGWRLCDMILAMGAFDLKSAMERRW